MMGGYEMKSKIDRLYNAIYSNYISPEDLVKNIKCNNYESITFKKSDGGLIANVKCEIQDLGYVEFAYFFDNKDMLLKIDMIIGDDTIPYFRRNSEIENLKEEILSTMRSNKVAL